MQKAFKMFNGAQAILQLEFDPDTQMDYDPIKDIEVSRYEKRWLLLLTIKSIPDNFHYEIGMFFSNKEFANNSFDELYQTLTRIYRPDEVELANARAMAQIMKHSTASYKKSVMDTYICHKII